MLSLGCAQGQRSADQDRHKQAWMEAEGRQKSSPKTTSKWKYHRDVMLDVVVSAV